jgi:acyl dehydratase
MPIDYETLKNFDIPEVRQAITPRDCILYALSVGLGSDPLDERQLDYVYERRLKAMPAMANVLAYAGFWLADPRTGVDAVKLVHGEQSMTIHAALPTEGTLRARTRVREVIDRGAGKGALLYSGREIFSAGGAKLATVEGTTFLRGDGGFGGPSGPVKPPHPVPDRSPDLVVDLPTRPEQALLYRLNGDRNPLHIDPAIAAKAGFERPILHGLCTFGVVAHALLRAMCGYDPEKFGRMDMRFSAPVFPGETIRTEIFAEPGGAAFRARVLERDVLVGANGLFRTRAA